MNAFSIPARWPSLRNFEQSCHAFCSVSQTASGVTEHSSRRLLHISFIFVEIQSFFTTNIKGGETHELENGGPFKLESHPPGNSAQHTSDRRSNTVRRSHRRSHRPGLRVAKNIQRTCEKDIETYG